MRKESFTRPANMHDSQCLHENSHLDFYLKNRPGKKNTEF